MVIYTL